MMPGTTHIPESDFLRLFVKHEAALRSFARVLLPTWESVDEVMQETSVVMWKKLSQLDTAESFLPWVKMIVRFESLRLRRDFARDRHVFGDAVIELLANEAAEVHEDVWGGCRRIIASWCWLRMRVMDVSPVLPRRADKRSTVSISCWAACAKS